MIQLDRSSALIPCSGLQGIVEQAIDLTIGNRQIFSPLGRFGFEIPCSFPVTRESARRRPVAPDCVHHHEVRASEGGFRLPGLPRSFCVSASPPFAHQNSRGTSTSASSLSWRAPLAGGGMLARRHARPGGEVAPTGELAPVPDRRHDRMGGDEADARNGAEPPHVRIGFGDLSGARYARHSALTGRTPNDVDPFVSTAANEGLAPEIGPVADVD